MIVGASLNPIDYGAVGGASGNKAANSIAIQACVDAAIASGVGVHFTGDNYYISTAITISSQITITADNGLGILCFGCDGFVIQAGVQSVTIDGVYIAHSPSYIATTNTYSGVKIVATGSPTSSYNCFRNLFINGFRNGIYANYTWASNFEGLKILNCGIGIYGAGLCVNNMVSNCQIIGTSASIAGIQVGDGTAAAEGWLIQNNLIFGQTYGVYCYQSSNNNITNNIIDGIVNTGILLFGDTFYGATTCTITDNYIAGPTLATGIRCKNDYATAVAQYRGNYIAGNQILGYTTLAQGITVDGLYERKNIILGNRTVNKGASGYDCLITVGADHIVANNIWQGLGFYCIVPVIYSNNVGPILAASNNLSLNVFNHIVQYASTIPTTGTWVRGDIVWNESPSAGGTPGWVCVTSGTPGTWKAMANLAA
jgi:parallel beta-helix repeat protein